MFVSIVAGTDGSQSAGGAVAKAVELAKLCGASLHLVTAYRPLESLFTAPELMPVDPRGFINPREDAEKVLEEAAAKVRAEGIDVITHAVSGDAPSALIEVAEAQSADCIVVGNRGMQTKARFLLGSVPNKIAHHAPCTVMIVKTD